MAATTSLRNALAAGQVGERHDGYLALVDPAAPGEARALVEAVNARRRARYAQAAVAHGVTAEEVGRLSAKRLIARAPAGAFIMDPEGSWRRR